MKKITICISIIVCMMVALISGCSLDKKSTSSSSKNDSSKTVQCQGSEYAKDIKIGKLNSDQKNVKIMWSVNFSYWEAQNTEEAPDFHIITKKVWEETTGGQVTVEVVAEASQQTQLATEVASGSAPDLIPVTSSNFPTWQITNFSKNMDDEDIKNHLDFDNKDLWDLAASSLYKWNNHYAWLIPKKKKDPMVIVYNKTKFENAGEKTPMELYKEGNWTWTQFQKTARNMTDEKQNEYGFTGFYLKGAMGSPYKLNSDGLFYSDYSNPEYLRKWSEIYNFYQTKPYGARHDSNINNYKTMIPSGSDAMCASYLSDFKTMNVVTQENGGDELRIAPLFSWDVLGEKTYDVSEKTWGYSICSAAANPVGAAEYIRLESLIAQKIEKSVEPEFGIIDNYLSNDEKTVLRDITKRLDSQVVSESDRTYSLNISTSNSEDMANEIFSGLATKSIQAYLDESKPEVEAGLKKINDLIKQYSK